MAYLVKHIGSYATKTSANTLAWLWPSSSAAGNLLIATFVHDNFTTTLKPEVTGISKPAGETATWTRLGFARSASTSAGAFASGEMWAILTTVDWVTPTITATYDNAVAMRSMAFSEYGAATATLRSTVGQAYSTSTTAASATTTGTAPVIGDLAVGLCFGSNLATVLTGDNDTTAGTWSTSTGVGSTGGAIATNNMGSHQYKVLTAATHQTYNHRTTTTAGNGAIVAILQGATPPKMEGLTDHFPGTTLDTTKWTEGLWNAATGTLVAGQAQIILTSGYSNLGAIIGRWSAADSSFYAKVTPPPNILSNRNVGMYCYLPDNNNRITLAWTGSTTPTLKPNVVVGGTSLYNPSITYDPVSMAWWKISFSGTNIYWYTSPDGVTWTQQWTYSEATLSRNNVLLRFEAGTSAGDVQTSVAYIDNVNVPGAAAKAETLTDDFATQIDPAKWTAKGWTGGSPVTGTGGWVAGQVALTELNGGYSSYASVANYSLLDSSVFAKVTPPAVMTDATETFLTYKPVGSDNENGIYFIIALFGANPYLVFRERRNDTNNDTDLIYDPVDHAFLRIRSVGQTVYWDTSPDGTTWTDRRSLSTLLDLTSARVEMWVGQWESRGTQGTGYFDNINTVPAGGQALTLDRQDGLGVTDAQTDQITVDRADSEAVTDAQTDIIGLARSDNLPITDAQTDIITLDRVDLAKPTDSMVPALARALTLDWQDAAALTDAATSARGAALAGADGAGLTDSWSTTAQWARASTDTANLTDSVTAYVGQPKTETLTDTFDTTLDKAVKWPATSTQTVWDASGRAKIPCAPQYYNLGTPSAGTYDFTGSSVYANLTLPSYGNGSRQHSMEIIRGGTGTLGRTLADKLILSVDGTDLVAQVMLSGEAVNSIHIAAYDPVAHAWWRLRESGGNTHFETSPNGTAWTDHWSFPNEFDVTSVWVNFSSGYWDTESASDLFIDNINTPYVGQALTLDRQDSLGVTDTQTDIIGLARSDTGTLTDSAVSALAVVVNRTDLLGLTDSVAVAKGAVYAATDNLSLVDAKSLDSTLARSDNEALTDTRSSLPTLNRAETATLTDSMSVAISRDLDRTDALGLTDAVTTVLTPGGPFTPDLLPGLVSWLDANDYTGEAWFNRGSGPAVTFVGTPMMSTGALQNGMWTVRFKTNEGRLRSTFPYPVHDYTLVYLVRWVGPGVGRAFSVQYPPSNITIGMHTTAADTMYDNGTWLGGYGWNGWQPPPGPWRMYGADCAQGAVSRFFVDGEFKGSPAAIDGGGLTGGWGLSGYESNGTGETMDIEVAEVCLYDHRLSDLDRQAVEDYLYQKWLEIVPQALTLDVTDDVGLTDTFDGYKTSAYTATSTDNLALSDAETSLASLARADVENLADSWTTVAGFGRAQSDLAALSDAITIVHGFGLDRSDLLGATDTQTDEIGLSRPDTENLTDTVNTARGLALSAADTENLTDTVSAATGAAYSASDTANLTDSKTSDSVLARSDVLGLTDTLSVILAFGVDKSDALGLTDSKVSAPALDRTENETLTDSRSVGFPAIGKSDSLELSDTVDTTKSSAGNYSISEPTGLADSASFDASTARAESEGLTDSASATPGLARADGLNLTDSWSTVAAGAVARQDTESLTDLWSLTAAWSRSPTDITNLTDTITVDKTSAGALSTVDVVGLIDTRALVATKALTDLSGLTDNRALIAAKALTDLSGLTDTRAVTQAKALTDLSGLTDSISVVALLGSVGQPKVDLGAGFVAKPGKVYLTGAWREKPWKYHDGSAWVPIGGAAWDADTQAYLTATGLDSSYASALDGLVTGLKTKGLWSKMAAIYPFIGGTADLHKWNLKDPRDLDAAYRLTYSRPEVSSHSTALGYRPNAQGAVSGGGYADTRLTPRGILDQDSTSLAYYSLADVPPISRCEMGCYNWAGPGTRFHIIARYTPTDFYYGMSEDGITGAPVPASSGLFVATRTAANYQAGYRNGALVANSALPSIWLPDVSIWVGGINTFVDRSDLPCGFASVGTGLDAQNNADLYTVVQAYQTALGRQV